MITRDSGVPVARAVAASCCLPGIGEPITIAGRRYIDGGFASIANADLADAERLLVVAFRPGGVPGERVAARVVAQIAAVRERGAAVQLIVPDSASMTAIGPPPPDFRRRPAIVESGIAQGRAEAGQVAALWG